MLPTTPPTTPPACPVPLPGTPVHTRSATTDRFLPKYEDREATFRRLSIEMSPFFVGPVPPQDFLDFFLPSTSCSPSGAVANFRPGIFTALAQSTSEAEMYGNLVSSDPIRTRSSSSIFLG